MRSLNTTKRLGVIWPMPSLIVSRLIASPITENPLHYNIRRGLVRRVNLTPQFDEYYLPFMIWKDRVVILAVAHAKRRPYYWRKRIGEAKKMF